MTRVRVAVAERAVGAAQRSRVAVKARRAGHAFLARHRTRIRAGRQICLVGMAILGGCKTPGAERLDAARRALGQGEYLEAVAHYREVTLEAPGTVQSAQALYEIGSIYYLHLRDTDAARAALLKLIDEYDIDEDDDEASRTRARRLLARIYVDELGDPLRAIDEYTQLMVETDDADLLREALLSRAVCHYDLDNLEEAAADYQRVIEEWPVSRQFDEACLRLAHIRTLQERRQETLGVLDRLLEMSYQEPSRRKAYRYAADVLVTLRRYREARAYLELALREFPNDEGVARDADKLRQKEQEHESLEGDDHDSREILKALQDRIRWGGARRARP